MHLTQKCYVEDAPKRCSDRPLSCIRIGRTGVGLERRPPRKTCTSRVTARALTPRRRWVTAPPVNFARSKVTWTPDNPPWQQRRKHRPSDIDPARHRPREHRKAARGIGGECPDRRPFGRRRIEVTARIRRSTCETVSAGFGYESVLRCDPQEIICSTGHDLSGVLGDEVHKASPSTAPAAIGSRSRRSMDGRCSCIRRRWAGRTMGLRNTTRS
jgi:hypothetical protein